MGFSKDYLYNCEHPDYSDLGLPQKLIDELLGRMTGCVYCNSTYDREDDTYYYYSQVLTVEDLLDDIGFTEKQKDKLYTELCCPNCGCELDSESEITVDEYYFEEKYHAKYIEKLTKVVKPEIIEFNNYLIKYPYLGCKHKIGKRLIKDISNLSKMSIEEAIYFRARAPHGNEIFTITSMLPPDPNDSKVTITEGRFNHFGQSHWYLGNSKQLCGAESSHKKNCILWFQKIKIKKAENILDLSKEYISNYYNPDNTDMYSLPVTVAALLLSGFITKPQEKEGSWKPEYILTRFIADICKEQGINGILYPSSLYQTGKNLVVFDISKIDYEFLDEPSLEIYKNKDPLEEYFKQLEGDIRF